MSRRGVVTANRVLVVVFVTLGVTMLLPVRMLGWTREPGMVVQRLSAPPADMAKVIGDWIAHAEPAEQPDALVGEIEHLQTQLRKLAIENQRLRRENADLRGAQHLNSTSIRLIPARIMAGSADPSGRLLRARAGRRDGIRLGSVASVRGEHLLGRVVSIDRMMCEIMPITDHNADTIEVIVYGADAGDSGLRFDLSPVGDGTLRGPGRYVTDGPEQTPREAKVGQRVYLSDEAWSVHAGLVVGEIISVEAS
ncbi:MAG TPA: hypothetical protein ENJ00_02810, partial [Phycisphaerales bacterium]|nr:hypothetical protein [Phycisphaerales bacterium]